MPPKETDARQCQRQGEIAYLRGDFLLAKRFCAQALKAAPGSMGASYLAIFAAISTNDFPLYRKIESSLQKRIEQADEPCAALLAETVLAAAAVSMFAPKLVPDWLKEGDFSHLPEESLSLALYLRVKYLQNIPDFPQMLAVAQTTLALGRGKSVVREVYLSLMCAIACLGLNRLERAREYVFEALSLGMPYGFLTPFAENVIMLDRVIEKSIAERYPHALDAVLAQWRETWKHWAAFHNLFARDKVTLLLNLREYRIATLAASRMPYAQIAAREGISIGRVRNIVQEIYDKLLVRNRDELADLVLWNPKQA